MIDCTKRLQEVCRGQLAKGRLFGSGVVAVCFLEVTLAGQGKQDDLFLKGLAPYSYQK